MDVSQEFAYHKLIFKGKRTRRPRPSSLGVAVAVAAATTVTSSSSITGGGGSDGGGGGYFYSPTTSTIQISSSTEEDEDMANCLMLLAQSGCKKEVESEGKIRKFISYQCKTCNKTFPSFQALGGHRASHRNPKTMVVEKKATFLLDDEEKGKFVSLNSSLSTQIVNQGKIHSKSKIHECSICGSEFLSGQALGGHMRRHKPPQITPETDSHGEEKKNPRKILLLDLNMPAPTSGDENRDTQFNFSSKQQSLVFSAAALVDWHF